MEVMIGNDKKEKIDYLLSGKMVTGFVVTRLFRKNLKVKMGKDPLKKSNMEV
jgi:hypothetical protein